MADEDNKKNGMNEDVDNSGSSNDNEGNSEGNNNEQNGSNKTFTQEQVNKMMAKEKNQGRNAVYNELGIDPKDKTAIAQFKAFIESQKTDETREAEAQKEREAKQAEAERRLVVAETKAEAMMLGIKPQYVEDAVTLALSKATEDSDIKSILGEFKTKYPVWFEEKDDDDKYSAGKKGTGSSVKGGERGKKSDAKGLGSRLAAQRKTQNKKSSYWGNIN